ncbi:MAG: phytanoyl-CoA dioxygenase family protein [Pseudomonadales bacterium]|jgi:hypothetical protein
MITLPHHCEFLTPEWAQRARTFIAKRVAAEPARYAASFTLSLRLQNAPPHLGLTDNVGAWTLRCCDEAVTITPTFDDDADLTLTGDYQAALTAAQTVGALAPGALAAALREVEQLYGANVITVRGTLPDAASWELVAQLYDHLARQTVENPDLAHRAARLGITRQVREMEEQGYTVLEGAISPAFADELRDATLQALLPHHGTQLQWMLYHGRAFERVVQNPKLMTLIDVSLGRGAVIASLSAIRRGPGPGFIPMHTDYSMIPEPYPEFAMTGVGVWAMEDWTVASGPTWIVPGSHRLRRGPRRGEGIDAGVPIEMPQGSVVFFTHGVWHWQGDRTEPGERVTLHAHFNRGILRGLEPKKIDIQMLYRNPPRLGEMLGEDDWFDKLTAAGRDHTRAAYMARLHQFSEAQKQVLLEGARG